MTRLDESQSWSQTSRRELDNFFIQKQYFIFNASSNIIVKVFVPVVVIEELPPPVKDIVIFRGPWSVASVRE